MNIKNIKRGMKMKILYEDTPKSVLIKAYRNKMKENPKNFTTVYNNTESIPSLKRPCLLATGKSISWVEFSRLPRNMVAVQCFLYGVIIDGVTTVGDEEE